MTLRACLPTKATPCRTKATVAVGAVVEVERFELPTDALQSVASSAGLAWVMSDADKVRAVQDAMAREPKPVHVPREIKPVVIEDVGPLILVETKTDLSQVRMPFESRN